MHQDTFTQWTERIQGIPSMEPLYANDGFVSVLLVCFFVIAAILSSGENIISTTIKNLFRPHEETNEGVRTTSAQYQRIGMLGISLLSTALVMTVYLIGRGHFTSAAESYFLPLLFGIFIGIYLLKIGVFNAINWVFFDRSQMVAWRQSYANCIMLAGIPMFMLAIASVFLELSQRGLTILLLLCIITLEICLFFKAFHIFCAKKYGVLLLIVYLCTLELMPLLLAGKALVLYL
ncbi:MAG: DUF4271 domain-containing protein [Bacteroidaceae bacterium]|nr:DUF4271 domain-containing protein [Bacteroidaceae bacterium]